MNPLLFYIRLMQAQMVQPGSAFNQIFELYNHEDRCQAVLDNDYAAPSSATKKMIINSIRPLAEALNLTFKYEDYGPFAILSDCYQHQESPTSVEVRFCNTDSDVLGQLRFIYMNHLFNKTQIKAILDNATPHNQKCGEDLFVYFGYVMAGIAGLGVLICLTKLVQYQCIRLQKEYSNRSKVNIVNPQARDDSIFRGAYKSFDVTQSKEDLAKPSVWSYFWRLQGIYLQSLNNKPAAFGISNCIVYFIDA